MKIHGINPLFGDLSNGVKTPAGLIVTADAYDGLVKAEARRIAAEDAKKHPQLFSPYALYQNMQVYGAREKPRGTPQFPELYQAAERSFIDRIIIQARIDQSKMVWQRAVEGRQLGFKVVHERHADPSFKPSKQIQERCAEMEKLLSDPTPIEFRKLYPHERRVHDGLKDLVSRLVRAELVIDRKVLYRYKRRNGKGYAAFHWLPGATIKPVHEAVREWQAKNDPRRKMSWNQVRDKMSALAGVDVYSSDYVQLMDGMITAGFTDDEIAIHIANPSDQENRWGYGESRLEISLDVTAVILNAWRYNQEMFRTNYPEAVLTVAGDFDKAGLDAFKQQLMGEAGGPGNNWRLPIINTSAGSDISNFKIESHKLRDTPKDMLYDQLLRMLFNVKCAAYGTHPSTINFSTDTGGGSNPLSTHDPASEINFAKEHGFKPHLMDMCAWLTDSIIKPNYDDLRLIMVGLEDENEKEQLEIVTEKGKNYLTRNDMRMMDGKEPKGFWVADEDYKGLSDEDKKKYDTNPWNFPTDAPIPSYLSSFQQAAQLEQMGEQQGQDNEEDDDQEEDDSPWADQGDDEEDQDGQDRVEPSPWDEGGDGGSQEPVQKSQPDVRFLRITID